MEKQRVVNDHNFECKNLSNTTVEYFSAFYHEDNKDDILIVVLKLKELPFYQKFFLDAGIGFWEEWNKEDTFYDFDDCERIDLAKEFDLINKRVISIMCNGSVEACSSISFKIDNIHLLLKFNDNKNLDSDINLVKL